MRCNTHCVGGVLQNILKVLLFVLAFSVGPKAMAGGSVPSTTITTYEYAIYAGPTEVEGRGMTRDLVCSDFVNKNGWASSYDFSAHTGNCEIYYKGTQNTWRFAPIAVIANNILKCHGEDTWSPWCQCKRGQEPNKLGTACIPEKPKLNISKKLTGNMCTKDGEYTKNPIIPATGEKFLQEEDYRDGTAHGLTWIRTYNSLRQLGVRTGNPFAGIDSKWNHSHNINLTIDNDDKHLVFGDGTIRTFVLSTATGVWTSTNAADTLTENTSTGNWTYVDKASDKTLLFNAGGRILTETLRNGWTTTYGYSTSSTSSSIAPYPGLLISVTNHFGRAITLQYNSAGVIWQINFPSGKYAQYTTNYYSGMLTKVEWAPGHYNEYYYENSSDFTLLTGILSNGNRYSTYAYDTSDRAVSSALAGGVDSYSVSYVSATDRVVTDPLGTQRTYSYSTNHGDLAVVGATLPSDSGKSDAASRVQDADGLITSETDFLGVITNTTWDSARRLPLSVTKAYGRPEEQTIQYSWHVTFSLPLGITETGKATAYTYDTNGNKLSESVKDLTTNVARTTQWTYGTNGLPATMTDPKGGVWQFAYDTLGNLTSLKNPLNHETVYTWHSSGRLTQETAPNGMVTTYNYDDAYRMRYVTRDGDTTYYEYDSNDRVTSVQAPSGHKVWIDRDAAFRVTGYHDNLGNVTTYTLDGAGNRIGETVKDSSNNIALTLSRVINTLNRVAQIRDASNNATALTYNANGDLTSQTEPLSRTTSQTLDGLRRPTATTFADSSSASQSWNALDQVTGVTDPKGVQTTYTRNAFGEVMSETSPDVGTVNYVRDALGGITQRTDAKGNVTTITRDALGRPTTIQYGPSNIVTYTWDTAPSGTPNQKGFLSLIEDPSGSTSYERDLQGRVTKKTQLVNDNPSSPSSYVYTYEYLIGDLYRIGYPSGMVVVYVPNSDGRQYNLKVQLPGQPWPQDFTGRTFVTPLFQPKQWNYVSGTELNRVYDTDGRLTSTEFANYSYDAAGRISSITQSLAATTDTTSIFNVSVTWTVGYDNRDRVTSFTRAGAGSSYTYDANSNRLTSVESYSSDSDLDGSFTGTDATSINAKTLDIAATSNRLLGFTQILTSTSTGSTTSVVTTPISYSLDANGNMTSDGLRTFDYDESNRLSKVRILQSGEAASISYMTNGLGQRVFKGEPVADQYLPDEETLGTGFIAWLKSKFRWMFESAQVSASIGTAYVYADALPSWALLGEYDNGSASGTGRTEYIWQPNRDGSVIPVAMRRNGEFFTIHTDHLGTPRMVRDSTNKTVWQLPYSAFGNNRPVGVLSTTTTTGYAITPGATPLKSTRPAQALNLRFPGQYADSETGEFYNYFRQYDPKTGRYTQFDPVGLDGGLNGYLYAGANPLGFIDPLGLTQADIANAFAAAKAMMPNWKAPSDVKTWSQAGKGGKSSFFSNDISVAAKYLECLDDGEAGALLMSILHEMAHFNQTWYQFGIDNARERMTGGNSSNAQSAAEMAAYNNSALVSQYLKSRHMGKDTCQCRR